MASVTIEDREIKAKRDFVLAELMGCIGVLAKDYSTTVPGALAQICIREIYVHMVGECVTEFHSGPLHIQYRRISELLRELEPVALESIARKRATVANV